MSRAGEKLYGDFQRACDHDDVEAPSRRREQLHMVLLLLFILMVGGSAMFGFG